MILSKRSDFSAKVLKPTNIIGYLIMVNPAGFPSRGCFVNVPYVFLLLMVVKYGGSSMLSEGKGGRRALQRKDECKHSWEKIQCLVFSKGEFYFSSFKIKKKEKKTVHMPCGLKESSTGTRLLLYSIKVEIKVPTDKLNIL